MKNLLIAILFLLLTSCTHLDAKFMEMVDGIPYDLTSVFVTVNNGMLYDPDAPKGVVNPTEYDFFGVPFKRGTCSNHVAGYKEKLLELGYKEEDLIESERMVMMPWGVEKPHGYLTVLADDGWIYYLDNLRRVVIRTTISSYLYGS
jgi:hypothetical protein